MTIDAHSDEDEPQPGSTAYLLQEMQLYGHRPFEDEPDHRPLPDARIAGGAIADIFDALASSLAGHRQADAERDARKRLVGEVGRARARLGKRITKAAMGPPAAKRKTGKARPRVGPSRIDRCRHFGLL